MGAGAREKSRVLARIMMGSWCVGTSAARLIHKLKFVSAQTSHRRQLSPLTPPSTSYVCGLSRPAQLTKPCLVSVIVLDAARRGPFSHAHTHTHSCRSAHSTSSAHLSCLDATFFTAMPGQCLLNPLPWSSSLFGSISIYQEWRFSFFLLCFFGLLKELKVIGGAF